MSCIPALVQKLPEEQMRTFGWVEVHAVDHCNNNCRSCHNFSPFCDKTVYDAEAYFPWLDILTKNKSRFLTISIMGGEPMLHPDIIRFVYEFRRRYEAMLVLTTNGFWLDRKDIEYFDPLWKMLTEVKVSVYPNMVKRLGGRQRMDSLLHYLKERHPHLQVDFPSKYEFRELFFTEEPMEVQRYCPNSQCTALLPDGRMLRCGPGYHHLAPDQVTQAFRENRDMVYDLKNFDYESFWLWRNRFPLDACSHCGLIQAKRTAWKVEKGTGERGREYEQEYHLNMVQGLLDRGELGGAIEKGFETIAKVGESQRVYAYLSQLFDIAGVSAKARHYAQKSRDLEPPETAGCGCCPAEPENPAAP